MKPNLSFVRPGRFCVVTRRALPSSSLIRFVCGPEAEIIPDLKAQLPGRGVWVRARRSCVAEAVHKNVFARALQKKVSVDSALPQKVELLLKEASLNALGMACKAGQVLTGFSKILQVLREQRVLAVLHPLDEESDGVRTIEKMLRGSAAFAGLPCLRLFRCTELSYAVGRENVVHVAILQGHAGQAVLARMHFLSKFREDFDEVGQDGLYATAHSGDIRG